MTIDRRQFLKRSGAAALAAGANVTAGTGSADAAAGREHLMQADGALQFAVASDPAARLPAVPFHGRWQAGIVTPPPPAACFAAFNVTAADRAGLIDLLRTLTSRARFLSHGGVPVDGGPTHPPRDSGTLGPDVVAAG
jgi:deferrochelatase/peroxidase EfeB